MRLFICIAILATQTASACTNIKGVTLEGTYEMAEGDSHVALLRKRMNAKPSSKLVALDGGSIDHYEMELRYITESEEEEVAAVRDILMGNYTEAIQKLEAMETANPGDYSTAANLGTAYELAGNNEKALHWITEGIKRNRKSHYGTEWLHKKILETKITLESAPDYLKNNRIVLIPEGDARNREFAIDIDGNEYLTRELVQAFHYQLGERMLYVKPTDPIVADLLFCFAQLEANARVLEPAVELLKLAKTYGYHDQADIEIRLARYRETIESTPKVDGQSVIGLVLGFAVFTTIALALIILAKNVVQALRQSQS